MRVGRVVVCNDPRLLTLEDTSLWKPAIFPQTKEAFRMSSETFRFNKKKVVDMTQLPPHLDWTENLYRHSDLQKSLHFLLIVCANNNQKAI